MDVTVTGGEDLYQLARRLRKAGEKELIKSLQRSIKEEAKPIVEAQRRSVKSLPSRGNRRTGLRSKTAGLVRIQVKTAGSAAGVRIRVANSNRLGLMPRHLNKGVWRHPVFGNRNVWVTQTMPPGWFDRPATRAAPKVRRGVLDAMNDVAEKIAHGGI